MVEVEAPTRAAAAPLGVILSEDELVQITGYLRPADQLPVLHSRGFNRAFRNRLGRVTLERAHYEAVCAGRIELARPKVRKLGDR